MRTGLLAVVLLSACYEPPSSSEGCTITCTVGAANGCPGDLTCENGYCVAPGQVCLPTFTATTAGTGFACAIDDASALWCWGKLTGTPIATRVDDTRHWDSIDAGRGHICGIADGALYCWGSNDDREVSGSVIGDVAAPLLIEAPGISRWTQVSAGTGYTCAVGDGQLVCWGLNTYGQLGDGTNTAQGAPTPVAGTVTDWVAVATGHEHTCGVSTSLGVHCWGRNARGELGPDAAGDSRVPVAVSMGAAPLLATSVAVALQSSCAIGLDQQAYCWGTNGGGQLGDPQLVDPATTTMSAEPLHAADLPFTKLVGAMEQYCGLSGDAIYCWGSADAGGIGTGIWNDYRVFQKTIASGATDISVGLPRDPLFSTTDVDLGCAIVDGSAMCWGDNRHGQLGQGTATMSTTPTEVAGNLRFTSIVAGSQHICGISTDGILYCWGSTERAQTTGFIYGGYLGGVRTPCTPNPTDPTQPLCDVGAPRAVGYAPNPTAVAAGTSYTCALSNGVVSCWGTGTSSNGLKRDLLQPGGGSWKTLLPGGRDGQCGVAAAAMDPVYCIGNVIGNAGTNPSRVAQLDGFTMIGLGGPPSYGVFLDATGQLHGFGDNSRYQLGDGTTNNYAALMQIGTTTYSTLSTRASEIGTDGNFACAIRTADTKIECWGQANRGQTGAADPFTPSMTPNEVMNLSGCTALAAGIDHTCAICGGAVYCWGDNRGGQLAAAPSDDVTSIPRAVDMPAGETWVELTAGTRFTCARSENGMVACWGLSPHGALGNGTGSNLPVTVLASQID